MWRSANTGISAFIDQTGKITKQLGYGEHGTLKGIVNKNDRLTFYTKYGDFIPKTALIPAILLLLFSFFKKNKPNISLEGCHKNLF